MVLAGRSVAAAQEPRAEAPRCETDRCVEEEDDDAVEALLWVPRGLLRIPRLAIDASMRLVVLAARAEEDYAVIDTVDDLMFNDARTFGVVPSAFYETGFKPSVGARVIHRNLFGDHEGLKVRGLYAADEQQRYQLDLHSGDRFGALRLHGTATYEHNDSLRFYGLGTTELVKRTRGIGPRPVFERDIATSARYAREVGSGALGVSGPLHPRVNLGVTAQLRRRDLSAGDYSDQRNFDATASVAEVFTESSLTGLGKAATDGYGELMLSWDGRRATRAGLPLDLASTGSSFSSWLGAQTALVDARGSFVRIGADARHYIDLAHGDRVLMMRLRTSWAIGHLDEIPFPDLPTLGGPKLLRGYTSGRFHDRGSLLGTIEYRYPVQDNLASYVFIDTGRVLDNLYDISPSGLRDFRVSWGAGMYLFSGGGLLLRGQLASSIDGGVFINLLLDADDDYAGST
jgi:outer membrane protein assembly factor BamA